jgi:hypothetical protein
MITQSPRQQYSLSQLHNKDIAQPQWIAQYQLKLIYPGVISYDAESSRESGNEHWGLWRAEERIRKEGSKNGKKNNGVDVELQEFIKKA